MPLNGHPTGFVVSEYSPYETDLVWDEITEPDEIGPLVEQLGRATAKIHCVSDDEAEDGIITFSVEEVVARSGPRTGGRLLADLAQFAHAYARRAQDDHRLFVEAFRAGGVPARRANGRTAGSASAGLIRFRHPRSGVDRSVRSCAAP